MKQSDELVKKEFCVYWARACLWMELGREPWMMLMPDSLVRPVVHVYEELLPIGAERLCVYSVAVVLRSYEALLCANHAHRLVV